MTLVELAILARDTRNAQASYFATRSPAALKLARQHERMLDQAVAVILFQSGPRIDADTDHD